MRATLRASGALLLWAAASLAAAQPAPAPAPPLPFAQPVLGPRGPLTADQERDRQQWLAQARQALLADDPAAAQPPLDRAAAIQHSADTELLMVQQMMQRGAYRQALAFAAHAAGAHADVPQARALYAWLAALGGQAAFADAQLTLGLQRLPDDAVLLGTRQALASLQPAGGPPLTPPGRPGPWATGAQVPPQARPVGGGVLLAGGAQALLVLTPAAAAGAGPLWVRDGLGRTRAIRLAPGQPGDPAMLAQLASPLPGGVALAQAPVPAFAGSPAVVLGYLPADDPQPAWPALHLGFLGRPAGDAGQVLGIALPPELPGAAVLDLQGRLLGLSTPSTQAAPGHLLPLPALRKLLGDQAEAAWPVAPAGPRRTPDELYEQALPAVLQVLAVAPQW